MAIKFNFFEHDEGLDIEPTNSQKPQKGKLQLIPICGNQKMCCNRPMFKNTKLNEKTAVIKANLVVVMVSSGERRNGNKII